VHSALVGGLRYEIVFVADGIADGMGRVC
jgi:hypothetical protein